jgi:hypothetical protein
MNYDAVRPRRVSSCASQSVQPRYTPQRSRGRKTRLLCTLGVYPPGFAARSSSRGSASTTREDRPVPSRSSQSESVWFPSSRSFVASKSSASGSPVQKAYPARRKYDSNAITARSNPPGTSTYTGTTKVLGKCPHSWLRSNVCATRGLGVRLNLRSLYPLLGVEVNALVWCIP